MAKSEIKGMRAHTQRMNRLKADARNIAAKLYQAGQLIETDAEKSITSGSISGANHVPSAPGQPPNADTRHLDTNIDTTIVAINPPTVHVTSHASYSAALEFGTSKMIERPFMRPAVAKNRKKVTEMVKQAVVTHIKRGS